VMIGIVTAADYLVVAIGGKAAWLGVAARRCYYGLPGHVPHSTASFRTQQ